MRLITLLSILIFSPLLAASTSEIEFEISRKVDNFIQIYDPSAFSAVKVSTRTSNTYLPTLGLLNKNVVVKRDGENPRLRSVDISLYTSEDFSLDQDEAKKAIGLLLQSYNAKVDISFTDLPSLSQNAPFRSIKNKPKTLWIYGFLAGVLFIGLVGVFTFFLNSRSLVKELKKLSETLEENISSIPNSYANDALTGPSQNHISYDQEDTPLKAVKIFFSDCYWCKEDAYASFIWATLPTKIRCELLEEKSMLTSYYNYISAMDEKEDLGLFDPSFYMGAKDLGHISNEHLEEAVKQNPAFYNSLSQMRQKHLSLTIEEKLQALRSEGSYELNISSIPSSKPRKIESKTTIIPESIEDEKNLLEQEIDYKEKKFIRSLVWINGLSKEMVNDILLRFSAQELAKSWIAPEETLDFMKSCISEKKFELISKLTKDIIPNRNCKEFIRLHLEIIKAISHETENQGEEFSSPSLVA